MIHRFQLTTFLVTCAAGWEKRATSELRRALPQSTSRPLFMPGNLLFNTELPRAEALTVLEATEGSSLDLRILATDLSTQILNRCRRGIYEAKKVEDIPPGLRAKYFTKVSSAEGDFYKVGEKLRPIIAFNRLNLMDIPYPMSGPMDAIFCRNVMIYFDNDVRRRLLGEYTRLLRRGGYLLVGHSESLTGMLSGFKPVMPSVYVKLQ